MHEPSALPAPTTTDHPAGSPAVAHKRGGEIAAYSPVPASNEPFPPDLQRRLIHGYYASVSYVDAQIGRVLDALDAAGLADTTIVVLWGDHGFHLGDHGIWTKHTNYEQANRIPLIIRAQGRSPRNHQPRGHPIGRRHHPAHSARALPGAAAGRLRPTNTASAEGAR